MTSSKIQTWDLPELFDLGYGGDFEVFVMDNHRPVHLKNIQSGESVTVFVEKYELNDGAPVEFEDGDLVTDDEDSEGEGEADEGDESEEEDDDDDDFDIAGEGDEGEEEEAFDGEGVDDEDEEAAAAEKEKSSEGDDGNAMDTKVDDDEGDGTAKDGESEEKGAEEEEPKKDEKDTFGTDRVQEGTTEDPNTDDAEGDTSREVDDPVRSEDEDEENLRVNKKRRVIRDETAERKEQVMMYKNTRASFSRPTSWLLLKLVSGQGNLLDTMWQCILGVTDQHERQRLDEEQYNDICTELHRELANYLSDKGERMYKVDNKDGTQEGMVVPGAQTGHIEEGQDYRFFLYRHWSLFESMCYSPYVSAKMKTWKGQGIYKLQEMLAKMGVSLEECKQMYSFMAPESKQHFNEKIRAAEMKENYFLTNPEVTCRSFYRFNSFKNPIAASDVVHAANALVEMHCTHHNVESEREGTRLKAFNDAYDCLGMHAESMLKKGLQSAINLQKMIVKKAGAVLEDDLQILKLKYLYYIAPTNARGPQQQLSNKSNQIISDEDEMDPPFCRPMVLVKLGHYIMDIKMNMDKRREQGWKGKKLLPLILAGDEQKNGKCHVVGIDPRQSVLSYHAREDADLEVLDNLCNFKGMFKAAAKGLGVVYPSAEASKCLLCRLLHSFFFCFRVAADV